MVNNMIKKTITSIILLLIILFTVSSQEVPEFAVTMLKINEVRPTGDFDFIEIYNTAPFGVMFPDGWYLLDEKLNYPEAIPIPEGTIIDSESFLLIIPDQVSVSTPLPAGIPVIYATEFYNFGLKAGDEVRLMYNKDSQEILVDILGWGGGANTWGYFPDGSTELYDNLIPTPGEPNKPYPEIEKNPTVRINEIQTKESSFFPYDFIELYNYGTDPVLCDGMSVTDETQSPSMELPPDLIINPGEYIVLVPNESDPLDIIAKNVILNSAAGTTFGLGKSDSVRLLYQGILIDSFAWDDGHHISIGLIGTDNPLWERNLVPTPGAANSKR